MSFYQVEPFATHFTPLNILNPPARTALSLRRSPWPSLRQRSRTLASEVYAEAVGEVVAAAQKLIPAAVPGVPPLGARIGNLVLACIAFVVAVVGHVERLLNGGRVGGLAVNNIREASLPELQSGAGDLSDKRLLPSAYEVWDGPRPNGYLRVRYLDESIRIFESPRESPDRWEAAGLVVVQVRDALFDDPVDGPL